MDKIKVAHYINQFFAGIGGEEKTDVGPAWRYGPIGPGIALQAALGEEGEVVSTIFCGDNYFNQNLDKAKEQVFSFVAQASPDILVAGPAFDAGRYGLACAHVCTTVAERLNIPVVSGMHLQNPGVELCRRLTYIVESGESAAAMRRVTAVMAGLALKLGRGDQIGPPAAEGYIPRGVRRNVLVDKNPGQRAVEMLLKKLKGESFVTELPLPTFSPVPPPSAIHDLRDAVLALVTEAGVVPKGNPDRLEWTRATKWIKYDIAGIDDLTGDAYTSAHGMAAGKFADEDPDRLLPLDVLREMEKENVFKKLLDHYYVTVGNGTSVESATKYAHEIAKELLAQGVDAVVLTGT